MAENESRKQGRQPGDIPRSVRQRTGSSGSSSEDEASAADEAKDKAWHEDKGVPYAPIGSPFAYAGSTFLRTGERAAKCAQPGCSTTFNSYTYHARGLGLHAKPCLEKLAKKQQQEVAWDGVVTTSHTFEGGKTVSVDFKKIVGTGARRCVKCTECETVLHYAAESVRETHIKQKHKPEPTLEDKLKDELGVKGKDMWTGFFGKAKKRGADAKKEREERNKELAEAKQAGVEPPPPPPPPPLARTARPPPPPPLPQAAVPAVQQRSDDFLETIDGALQSQQRRIDRYARLFARAGVADDSDDDLDDVVDMTRCLRVCRGFSLKLGPRVGASYPYGLDDTSRAWTLPDDQGRVRACGERPCEGIVTDGNESCGACERLKGDQRLVRIRQRALDPELHRSGTIVRNAPTAPIFSVFSSGTAKLKGYELSAADLSWISRKTTEIWQAEYAPKHGPLASVATDADSLNKLHRETCALCLGPAENCPVFVVGSRKQPRVVCKVFAPTASADAPDDGVKFKAKSLEKSTDGAPSTNRPVVCPLCHPELADPDHLPPGVTQKKKRKTKYRPAIWSYNAAEHHKRVHTTSVMPPAFFNACTPSPEERAKLAKLLK